MRVNPRGNKPQAKRVMDELLAHDEAVLTAIRERLSDIYNECGPDLGWAEKVPGNPEFVSVLCDLFAQTVSGGERQGRAIPAPVLEVWRGLSSAAKRSLCLSVGP